MLRYLKIFFFESTTITDLLVLLKKIRSSRKNRKESEIMIKTVVNNADRNKIQIKNTVFYTNFVTFEKGTSSTQQFSYGKIFIRTHNVYIHKMF